MLVLHQNIELMLHSEFSCWAEVELERFLTNIRRSVQQCVILSFGSVFFCSRRSFLQRTCKPTAVAISLRCLRNALMWGFSLTYVVSISMNNDMPFWQFRDTNDLLSCSKVPFSHCGLTSSLWHEVSQWSTPSRVKCATRLRERCVSGGTFRYPVA